ncbi:MAG TPA: thiamine pyrophosphate-binding protein [Allosphingosinicella sp.]|nr:thiamine pyrophosphate-binding protein [Allosphingosinicella sp.]
MRVYEAIVKGLESIGVDAAFGGAGETAAGMMMALHHSKKIRGIITRHEQAASFMACGYAMYTNKLGVCWATAGPGAFNFFNGLGMAMSDSYPMLAITGYANDEWEGKCSLNETSGRNRTPDSKKMFEACCKGSWHLTDVADTMDVLEAAVNCAYEGRPGPVHISIPGNLAHKDHQVTNYRDLRLEIEPVRPDQARIDEAAQVLAQAINGGKSVVALVGFGAIRSGAGAAIRHLIERFQIPLVTTLDGKGIVSENHPLSIGVFCDSGHPSAWKAFMDADVVLAIGNAFNQHATFNYWPKLFDGKTLIHVNISEMEIDKAYKADHAVVADARLAVRALSDALEPQVGARPPAQVDGRDYEARKIVGVPMDIHPGRMAQIIGRMLPPDAILLADAGAHLCWLGYYVELEEGQNFRKAGEFGPMAGHTNGAIGVKVANPHRPVIVGCGDGCYSLAGFELMTAVEHDIPVIWIIFDDSQFKLIKLYQLSEFHESGLVEFQNPDFAAYAKACGANGYRVEDEDEFEAAFADALASNRPCVIDAKITRWAIPHYSPSPEGKIAALVEGLEKRFRGE